jgi:hypothetical protein
VEEEGQGEGGQGGGCVIHILCNTEGLTHTVHPNIGYQNLFLHNNHNNKMKSFEEPMGLDSWPSIAAFPRGNDNCGPQSQSHLRSHLPNVMSVIMMEETRLACGDVIYYQEKHQHHSQSQSHSHSRSSQGSTDKQINSNSNSSQEQKHFIDKNGSTYLIASIGQERMYLIVVYDWLVSQQDSCYTEIVKIAACLSHRPILEQLVYPSSKHQLRR